MSTAGDYQPHLALCTECGDSVDTDEAIETECGYVCSDYCYKEYLAEIEEVEL